VPIYVDEAFAHSELATLPFAADARQTRPNLKVQDGCGNRCSFCIIPTTRGPSRSVPLETCVEDTRRFADGDGQELVLSGINLGRWGRDLNPARNFTDLVAAVLGKTSLPRLRISSVEPMDWTPDLLALFREYARGRHPRLAPHAHLPLQSGSDAILRKMHRRYRPWHYAEPTAAVRAALPDAAIGADVMVGFPGETNALFQQSYDFIAAQPFTYLHLFPFSARPGTPGWELHRENPVRSEAVAERMAALRKVAEEKAAAFRRKFQGRTLSVVTLEGGTAGRTPALSANFLKVEITGSIAANRMAEVSISAGLGEVALAGRLADEAPAGAFASKI
jgi:threonylcarbamoyladenosine tRNA methylthiotransferase MtaB